MSTHAASCAIYGNRPQSCRDYPQPSDELRPGCTFRYHGETRTGSCQPEKCQEQACCNWARQDMEPGGKTASETDFRKPCRHLVWRDVVGEKVAEDSATYDPRELTDMLLAGMKGPSNV